MDELRRLRERADYEWDEPWTTRQAGELVNKGRTVAGMIASLKDGGLQAVAKHLGT